MFERLTKTVRLIESHISAGDLRDRLIGAMGEAA